MVRSNIARPKLESWVGHILQRGIQGRFTPISKLPDFGLLSETQQVLPGHYLLSRPGEREQQQPYWDIEYPDKVRSLDPFQDD